MPPKKNVSKKSNASTTHRTKKRPSQSLNKLLQFCSDLKADCDLASLLARGSHVAELSEEVEDAKRKFQQEIADIPFMALVVSWASNIDALLAFGERHVACILDLIVHGILPYENKKNHKLITLSELQLGDHSDIFDEIRSVNDWSLEKQEECVATYGEFATTLSELTCGLILRPYDADRTLTSQRRLSFATYIKILKTLSERERILAKIFYLGGSRSLEEVLSLKVEDIDFKNSALNISGEPISYPKHVVHDLKYFVGKRTKGYVFTGRTGEKIDPTVPYRALKLAATKLDLDQSFTFKDFVKNL
jgi:hypothetical protein